MFKCITPKHFHKGPKALGGVLECGANLLLEIIVIDELMAVNHFSDYFDSLDKISGIVANLDFFLQLEEGAVVVQALDAAVAIGDDNGGSHCGLHVFFPLFLLFPLFPGSKGIITFLVLICQVSV